MVPLHRSDTYLTPIVMVTYLYLAPTAIIYSCLTPIVMVTCLYLAPSAIIYSYLTPIAMVTCLYLASTAMISYQYLVPKAIDI